MHQLRARALQAIQLLACDHPQGAVRGAVRPGQAGRQAECRRGAMHAPIRLAVDQPIQRADQQPPLVVERHPREAALQRHAIARREIRKAPIRPQATKPVPFEQQPHAALRIHGHGMDQRLRPLPSPLPTPPLPIGAVAHQIAACIAQPQCAIVIHIQRTHAVIGQAGARAAIDDAKFQPVVAHQAFPGGEPEIAVVSLGDIAQRVVRQSVARTPAVDRVVAQLRRSRRCGRRGERA
jgi:hypothetical protein